MAGLADIYKEIAAKAVDLAVRDLEHRAVLSEEFASAAYWLTRGWGYEYVSQYLATCGTKVA